MRPVRWSQSCSGNSSRALSAVWKAWTMFGSEVSGSLSSIKSLSFSRASRIVKFMWSNFSQLSRRSVWYDEKAIKRFAKTIQMQRTKTASDWNNRSTRPREPPINISIEISYRHLNVSVLSRTHFYDCWLKGMNWSADYRHPASFVIIDKWKTLKVASAGISGFAYQTSCRTVSDHLISLWTLFASLTFDEFNCLVQVHVPVSFSYSLLERIILVDGVVAKLWNSLLTKVWFGPEELRGIDYSRLL